MKMTNAVMALVDDETEEVEPPPPPPAKGVLFGMVTWLDDNIRKPMGGTVLDTYIARPIKDFYCRTTKQH